MISLIIPANNEAALIGSCLEALIRSEGDIVAQLVIVANGCDDDTALVAQESRQHAEARGWSFEVLDLADGGKPGALNAGDDVAHYENRAYVDADVTVEPDLLGKVITALASDAPRYVSGKLEVSPAQSWITRAYRRLYQRLPFIAEGVPGAGFFAVNRAGRARWGAFPTIISDDTFVRLSFTEGERIRVDASYDWPLVEGWGNLVRVRRRQNVGVDEIYEKFPELEANAGTPGVGKLGAIKLFLREPIGFVVYGAVSMATKLSKGGGWSRGR